MNNEKNKNEIREAKIELINLFLLIKPKKVDDVLKQYNQIYLLFQSNQTIEDNVSESHEQLINKSLKELVDNIKSSIDIIVSIKLEDELQKYLPEKDNPNSATKYETLLQKEEEALRQHISVEHQLKIQCEKFAEKLDVLEGQKIMLINEIVS